MTTRRKFLQTSSFLALVAMAICTADARERRGGTAVSSPPSAVPKVITTMVSDDQPAQILGGNFTRGIDRAFPLTLGQVNGSSANLKPGVPIPPTTFGTYNGITLYPNAYCDGPVCEPARAGIFTGALDSHHTIHTNQDDEWFDETTDISNSLYNAGWLTALFGKRFVNFPYNLGFNGNGPGKDGSGNSIVHIPRGYTYGFINVAEPVNPYQYTMIKGPQPGFTPEQAWAGNVANPGSCIVQAYDFNNTAGNASGGGVITASQSGTTLTITGWVGPVVAANLSPTFSAGAGNISAGMTMTIPGFSTVTIGAQLTSTDPSGTSFGNGTYTVSPSQTFSNVAGCIGTQTNTTKNSGHNSVSTLNAYLAWLNANKTAILGGQNAYGYVAPFSPHDPPIAPPQDSNAGSGGTGYGPAIGAADLDPLPSFNSTGTNGPSFYAAQPQFSTNTSPTLSQVTGKVTSSEQAVLSIDRAISGTAANSGADGILATLNGWGILSQSVLMYTTDQGVNYAQWKWETKRTQHDSTMRVPFFAFWGSAGPATGFNNTPVSHCDIAVTVAALAGVNPAAPQVDGVSIIGATRTAVAGRWVGGDAGGTYNSPPNGDGGSSTAFDLVFTGSGTYFRTEPFAPVTGTCTISIANPAVITYANNFGVNQVVNFTTTGALPTGLSPGVNYYVLNAGLTSSSFRVSLSPAGAAIATSGSQSGTQSITDTGTIRAPVALTEEGLYNYGSASSFMGSISAGALAAGTVTGDALVVGHVIKGAGVTPGNYITANNGGGNFTLFYPDTVGSEALTATDSYQMNNVAASGSYSATKTAAIAALNGLLPNFCSVNDPTYAPAVSVSGDLIGVEPARSRDGMLIVAEIQYRGSAPFTVPSGWAVAAPAITATANSATGNTAACGCLLLWRIRSGPLTLTDRTFTRTGGNTAQIWIWAYDVGGRTVSLLGGQSAQATVSNSTTVSVSGFTSSVDNQAVLVFGAHARNTSAFNVNSTLPAVTSGSSNSLLISRSDPYSAPQTGHWTQKDTQLANDGTLYCRGICADGMLAKAGQSTGAISYTVAIGALPSIMAATFSAV